MRRSAFGFAPAALLSDRVFTSASPAPPSRSTHSASQPLLTLGFQSTPLRFVRGAQVKRPRLPARLTALARGCSSSLAPAPFTFARPAASPTHSCLRSAFGSTHARPAASSRYARHYHDFASLQWGDPAPPHPLHNRVSACGLAFSSLSPLRLRLRS